MAIKSISFFYLLFTFSCTYSNPFAVGLMITRAQEKKQCTGKVAQHRQPLFVKAEKHEKDFTNSYAQCLQTNNCDTHEEYQQARHSVLYSITQIMNHLQNLEQDANGICHAYEKTEAKDIKKRLTELLTATSEK